MEAKYSTREQALVWPVRELHFLDVMVGSEDEKIFSHWLRTLAGNEMANSTAMGFWIEP